MSRNIDDSCLIIRNFPASFSEEDIREFLQIFDPIELNIFVSQHTAIAEFKSFDHTRNILTLLHQEILDENRLFVEYAPKNRSQMAVLCSQVNNLLPDIKTKFTHQENPEDISKTLKRLYATADNLNFDQPPPPHLYYEYPKVNRDTIDAICIALECVPKFYTQVLHLMNRMNLEPPFVPGDKRLVYESSSCKIKSVTATTQTDEISWKNFIRNKRKFLESDESELESSNPSDDETIDKSHIKTKRKKIDGNDSNKQEILKQKQKIQLKMQRLQKQQDTVEKSTAPQRMDEAFDLEQHHVKPSTIKIIVPEQLDTTVKPNELTNTYVAGTIENLIGNENISNTVKKPPSLHIWRDSELNENRIPAEQLSGHPMFQNYSTGEICNRLYIKNIAKEVTHDDLQSIYNRYLEVNCGGYGNIRSIDIRHMTSGRMKGQAFITFDGPYLNYDVDEKTSDNLTNKYQMIEKALHETNGLILKGKPLVVVYGKKK